MGLSVDRWQARTKVFSGWEYTSFPKVFLEFLLV
jgi:hypothetical protein